MYSYEDRMRAVKLYIQYGGRGAAPLRDVGYPSVKHLRRWYRHYIKTGDLPPDRTLSGNSYSPENVGRQLITTWRLVDVLRTPSARSVIQTAARRGFG